MNNLPTKTCLACHKILKGRIDKKFCDDSCRNYYNNQQNAATNNYARNIIHALRRNKRILETVLGEEGNVKTTRHRLLSRGFQFNYHTHTFKNKKGGVYVYCFEMGYLSLDDERYLVVKRDKDK